MHLPYTPRKSSIPATYVRQVSRPSTRGFALPRRLRQQAVAAVLLFVIALVWIITRNRNFSPSQWGTPVGMANHMPTGNPPVVIVTVFDESRFGAKYTELLKENRKLYAEKHGYATFFPNVGDYDFKDSPTSWNKVVAMRHAMTKFPNAMYMWYVDVDTFIMNPQLSIEKDIMAPGKLEEMMITDHPVVPPDSIIHTFAHLSGGDVDVLVTQDMDGLATASFVMRNSEWSRFFLETWFDPMYRSYNFQKAETHALEHIVQWHPTILSKLALVPQRIINSYAKPDRGEEYETGDLVVRFAKCARSIKKPTCEADAEPYASVWKSAYRNR